MAVKPRMLAPRTSAVSIAIFISNASTFLPRYSGVRPTMRPAMNTDRTAPMTSIPYMPAPMPPGVISPSCMLNSGTSPLSGWAESWKELTAPVLVAVVMAMNRPPTAAPKRCSLPSMLPTPAWATVSGNSGLPANSRVIANTAPTRKMAAIAAKMVQPWRWLLAYRPNVNVRANGTRRIANISSQFVSGVGLSNGWAELALRNPPPLLPSSLIHSCEAIGPSASVCCAPSSVVAVG